MERDLKQFLEVGEHDSDVFYSFQERKNVIVEKKKRQSSKLQ